MGWSEHSPVDLGPERYQSSRLAAAPGPDYGALNGSGASPFSSIAYPLTSDTPGLIADSIVKLSDLAGITTTMGSRADADTWLKDQQASVTLGSRGILADVKLGGLRRDLSLAFEMDEDADVSVSEQPKKFNQLIGEFVGNGDRLSSPSGFKPIGMPIEERFLWRDFSGSGTPFSDDIVNSVHVLRGPN